MKSDRRNNTPKWPKITIELTPETHAGLVKMAKKLDTTPERVTEGLLHRQPEFYLDNWGDGVWLMIAEYVDDVCGGSPKFQRQFRYLIKCEEHSDALLHKHAEELKKTAATIGGMEALSS